MAKVPRTLFAGRKRLPRRKPASSTAVSKTQSGASPFREGRLGHMRMRDWFMLASTACMLAVAIATAVIAFENARVARKQADIAASQKSIMVAQVQPEFVFDVRTYPGGKRHPGWLDPVPLRVKVQTRNIGARVRDFSVTPLVFIDMETFEPNGYYGVHDVLLPDLPGALHAPVFRSGKGALDVMYMNGGRDEATKVSPALRRLYSRRHKADGDAAWHERGFFHLYRILIADIRYVDMLGVRHLEAFVVGPSLAQRLPDAIAARLRASYAAKSKAETEWVASNTSQRQQSGAQDLYAALLRTHLSFPSDDTLWGETELALGRGTETGAYINHYEWPLD